MSGAEKLRVWMARQMLSCKELAARLNCHPVTLSNIRMGARKPTLATALAIKRTTDGEIAPEDWEDT